MTARRDERRVTLVLAGTGKTGRRVAQRLTAAGLPVRIGSRSGQPPFDWEDPATWAPVLTDVAAVYVAYSPAEGLPGAAETIGRFSELAVASGARRLVLLSGRGEDGALRSEQAVRQAGAEWTIVRSSFFAQNFSEDFLADVVREGSSPSRPAMWPSRSSTPTTSPTSRSRALTEAGHTGQVYEVTGRR